MADPYWNCTYHSCYFRREIPCEPVCVFNRLLCLFFSVNANKKVREKLSQGAISPKQIKMIYFSIAALFLLMFCIAGPFIPGWHWRQIWLGVLMATAIHFFLWFFIHGWSMVVLGIVCIIIAATGYVFPNISVSVICIADAAVKLICGVYLLFFSRPSKFIPSATK